MSAAAASAVTTAAEDRLQGPLVQSQQPCDKECRAKSTHVSGALGLACLLPLIGLLLETLLGSPLPGRKSMYRDPQGPQLQSCVFQVIKRNLHKPAVYELWRAYLPKVVAEANLGHVGAPHVQEKGFLWV